MLSERNIIRLSILFGIVSWVLLLVTDLIVLLGFINNVDPGISVEIPTILLNLFFIFIFIYYKYHIGKAESINFIDLLWRVFVTGLLTTVVSLVIRFFFYILGSSKLAGNALLINFFYHINLGLIAAFLISAFIVWKRLILYQKSKNLLRAWTVYEYSLLASILFSFFHYHLFDTIFNIIFFLLLAMGLYLSVNLKWVAYLNFKQKWKSILFLLLVIIYSWYFFTNLVFYSNNFKLATDLLNNVFILALFAFIFLYSIFSLLVLLFNLPTSSVFEQKLEEIINFQRLSQSIQAGKNETQVYEILLESSVKAVSADAAWIKIENDGDNGPLILTSNISQEEVQKARQAIADSKIKHILDNEVAELPGVRHTATLKNSTFQSVLALPLTIQRKKIGKLVMLKEVDDGFNKEMIDIITTFSNQACVSIENFRLLNEAIENERYKEELKIAKRVQRSLLPELLRSNKDFDIVAFSEASDEVGGDYYDTFSFDGKKVVVIGDVSGKGTSAAFHMSQLKGVFHSLVQLNLDPKKFMVHANDALSRCLEKSSFITLSYYLIDTDNKRVEFARAGHSPTLYYNSEEKRSCYFRTKGLGLGILRNSNFHKYVEVNEFNYNPGDIIILYTDGIIEARNEQNIEFGYDKLKEVVERNAGQDPKTIQENIINALYAFCGTKPLEDDYTLVIIKFKNRQ